MKAAAITYDVEVSRSVRHLPAVAAFAALTAFWMWPALRAPGLVVAGASAGDNLTFVWNTWWMQQALATATPPLSTTALFAPWGTSLVLNTHAAAPSFAGAVLVPFLGSAIAATNVILAVNLLLNFLVAYALAYRVTGSRSAAAAGGFVFGCSPYIGAHLQGHFNLAAAWVLPLSVLVALPLLERATRGRVVAAGLAWGTLVYFDYYYAVFAAVMLTALLATRAFELTFVRRTPSRAERLLLGGIGVLLAIAFVVLIIIVTTGGTVIRAGGLTISMHGTDNPSAAAGLLIAIAVTIIAARRVRVSSRRDVARADLRRLAAPLAIACVVSGPVLIGILALWIDGDYVSQRYFWRSAPAGVDVATMLLGNPNGLLTQRFTHGAYRALGIDSIEQSAWLGPAVIVLCTIALAARRRQRDARLWLVTGAIFATWAIGPYLVAAGTRVWVLLPATIVRFIPLISNARIPSRAMVVVSLSAAMLAAIAWRDLQQRQRHRLAACVAMLLLLDYLPARPPFFTVDRPSIYDVVASQPGEGSLCELPLGLRDGFGETGRLDTRVLAYQTRHNRPLTGGFVARLSPRVTTAYQTDAVLGPLLRLSAGASLSAEPTIDRHAAGARLVRYGIRYVMLNEETAPADLVAWARANLPLRVVATGGRRTLYAVDVTTIAGLQPSRSTDPSLP